MRAIGDVVTIPPRMFIHRFEALRNAPVLDGQGGGTASKSKVYDFKGRLRPASAKEVEYAEQLQQNVTHILYTRKSIALRPSDEVIGAGHAVRVQAERYLSRPSHHREYLCEQVV